MGQTTETKGISQCSIFDFDQSWYELLTESEKSLIDENSVSIHFKKGETVCKLGAFASHIYFLEEGLVKVYLEEKNNNLILMLSTTAFSAFLASSAKLLISDWISCCACSSFLLRTRRSFSQNRRWSFSSQRRTCNPSLETSSSAGRAWLVNTINAARNSSIASTDVILACPGMLNAVELDCEFRISNSEKLEND